MSIDNYVKLKLIGSGNYGEAWLVKNKFDRRKYVLKSVDLRFADEKERIGAKQEAELLSQLKHPNIVAYKESFNTPNGYLSIAMGFCEGGDLYHRLRQQNGISLPEQQIAEWFVQIAMAIKYMHDRHILHRDLKTQNIFLTKSEIIKVGDLGIARVLENSNAMATTMIGTPYYMSPELFSNKPYGYKSDVWALGCCIYEVMTLKHAFDARSFNALAFKIVQGKLPPMPVKYSTGLINLVKMLLQRDQSRRPTIDQILGDSYIKERIREFLEKTQKSQSTESTNHKRRIRNSNSSLSSQSDDLISPETKVKENSSKNVIEVMFGPDLERIDEEDATIGSGGDRTVPTKHSHSAEPKIGQKSEKKNFAETVKKKISGTKSSADKTSSSNSLQAAGDASSESKRDKRRKKKHDELFGQPAKSEEISDMISSKNNSAAVDYNSKQPTEHSRPATNDNVQVISKTLGNPRSDFVESIQFFGNSVFYQKHVSSDEETNQGTSNLHIGHSVPSDKNDVLSKPTSGRRRSSSDKENSFVAALQNHHNGTDVPSKQSTNHSNHSKLKPSVSLPQMSSSEQGSPKIKSKVKIARKLSEETVKRVLPLTSEPIAHRTKETSQEIQSDGKDDIKISKKLTPEMNRSSVLTRPLPPRPGQSAIEPTESQFHNKNFPFASQVQSGSNSTSVSSSASSANSSKDMDIPGSLNSSSRRRRRRLKETEPSYCRKSFDNAVFLSSDDQSIGIKVDAAATDDDDDDMGTDCVDGNFIQENLTVSFDVADSLVSEFCPEDKRLHLDGRLLGSFSVNGNDRLSVVDELNSSSSGSIEEIETEVVRAPRHKEIKSFISLLCSTLLINEKKSNEVELSEDEVEGAAADDILTEAENETALFIRRPLPHLNDLHAMSKSLDGKSDFSHDEIYAKTGRLFERITALRVDCLQGLGRKKLDSALKLVENFETEETEPQLIKLLGYEDFSNYAGKIWQLKYCMEHAFSSLHK